MALGTLGAEAGAAGGGVVGGAVGGGAGDGVALAFILPFSFGRGVGVTAWSGEASAITASATWTGGVPGVGGMATGGLLTRMGSGAGRVKGSVRSHIAAKESFT